MDAMSDVLLPGKQIGAFREYNRNRVALPPAKPHEAYDNEVGKRWTEIAKATDNLRGLGSANFADRWA